MGNGTTNSGGSSPAWLEVEGNVYAAKFNGPLTGNVTGNVTGSSGSCTGNSATASALDYTLATTTKAYLMASSDAPTSTTVARAAKGDTGVYLTTTAGELSAVKYSINVSGAEKVRLEYNLTD